MLVQDGFKVEELAQNMFERMHTEGSFSFQKEFQSKEGLFARADAVHLLANGSIEIFEVKSSTALKDSDGTDHIDDVTFQTIVAEKCGFEVRKSFIVHLNGDYVRHGEISAEDLLTIVDVTSDVHARQNQIEEELKAALNWIAEESIDERGCQCRYVGNTSKHCASFHYFNPDLPERSVHILPKISPKKLQHFLSQGRSSVGQIDPAEVTRLQAPIVESAINRAPVIDLEGISKFLQRLTWPLYFYDYETFASAIPIADGLRPQSQIPVQYSLHTLMKDGTLFHTEFLSTAPGMQRELVESLMQTIGKTGSVISWNKQFEISCNIRLSNMIPDRADFLKDINTRTVDLMDVFKLYYVDIAFEGSISIKKVLPIICPHLEYDKDAIHDGAGAMAGWLELVEAQDEEKRNFVAEQLRQYCCLDTLAMVEIFRFVQQLRPGD